MPRPLRLILAATLALAAFCLLALLTLPGADSGAATIAKKQKKITGTLSKGGYTVIALAADGEGKAAKAGPKFEVLTPAKRVTLHLRDRDGVYAGPIVVGTRKNGKRAIEGVKRGAKLGEVEVKAGKGYAKVKGLADKWTDSEREAEAKKGVPIGAGTFGLVQTKVPQESPPGDLDADGVADAFDIDDDGNLVLDRYEQAASPAIGPGRAQRSAGQAVQPTPARRLADPAGNSALYVVVVAENADGSVRSRLCGGDYEASSVWPAGSPAPVVGKSYRIEGAGGPNDFVLESVSGPVADGCPAFSFVPIVTPALDLTLKDTVNANAMNLTAADFDAALAQRAFLYIRGQAAYAPDLERIELDCGGLSYCTKGGTGRAIPSTIPSSAPRSWPLAFPGCCDANGNGFGELGPLEADSAPDVPCGIEEVVPRCIQAFYSPGATSEQIGTGDVFNWRIQQEGVESQFPRTLQDVFATVPALVSYADGAGNSTRVSYPVPPPYVGSAPDYFAPYNAGDNSYQGFPVAPCPPGAPAPCVAGDVVVTLQFWRPQREAIPGAEAGPWTDIGGLVYAPGVSHPGMPSLPNCDAGDVSTTDPRLSLTPTRQAAGFAGYGFRDSAPDRQADPANTLSFSVNLSRCLNRPLQSGEDLRMWLQAGLGGSDAGASAMQELLFTVE